MIRVAALTAGAAAPSARFRVRQHVPPLRESGIDVREHVPAVGRYEPIPAWPEGWRSVYAPHFAPWQMVKLAARVPGIAGSWRSDITWLQRTFLPHTLSLEWLLRRPLVFDVDDAIWTTGTVARAAAVSLGRRARTVIAGNAYIAEWFAAFCDDVRVIPTGVDTDRFLPSPPREAPGRRGRFTIGWTGTASNLVFLEAIEDDLATFFHRHPDAELLVVADRPPRFQRLGPPQVRFLRWSPEVEAEALASIDVGIMPLPDNRWTRGKCSYKMLQYMACAKPVVASPVGMNAELFARGSIGLPADGPGAWTKALEHFRDREIGAACGAVGREVVERDFSRRVVSRSLAGVFRDLAGVGPPEEPAPAGGRRAAGTTRDLAAVCPAEDGGGGAAPRLP